MTIIEPVIGIDLGTTNSVVAVLENDQPRILFNSEGSSKTPSVVSFSDSGEVLVGEIARRQAAARPEQTVVSIKRLMGRTMEEIDDVGYDFPFPLRPGKETVGLEINGVVYTPAQISAHILEKLKQTAEDYLGQPVKKAIITVPAHFDDLQRQATREAARLAGLDVLRLLNEPTAAAMAYGLGKGGTERIAVYDFGGGTFDLTILEISDNTFEVLTSSGDAHLGGDDIDQLLADYLLDQFQSKTGADVLLEPVAVRRLKDAAEKAKCDLSLTKQTSVNLPFFVHLNGQPYHMDITVSRNDLETLIEPLVDRSIACCRQALEDCELDSPDLDKVILVGGTSRIPLVQERVEEFFGIPPYKGINPDEIVALGAATQGGVMSGRLREVLLLDVTPHTLGIEIEGNKISRIIEKNSTIPIKAARLFTTTEDNQEMVTVHVVQGESDRASDNRSLGYFYLTGLQQARAGVPRVQVEFHINADGMVEVVAEDLNTHTRQSLSLVIGAEDEERRERTRRRRRSRTPVPSHSSSHGFARYSKHPTPARANSGTQTASPPPQQHPHPPAHAAGRVVVAEDHGRLQQSRERLQGKITAGSATAEEVTTYVKACTALNERRDARQALLSEPTRQKLSKEALGDLYDSYLDRFPDDDEVIASRANILAELGLVDAAIADFERICPEERGSDTQVRALAELYKQRSTRSSDRASQFKHARLLMRLNEPDEAIELLQPLVSDEALNLRALKALGTCYARKGMHYLAWQKLQSLPLTEEIKDMLYDLADQMETTEQLLNARSVLQHIQASDPLFKDVEARLANVERLIRAQSDPLGYNVAARQASAFRDSRFVILEEVNRGSMGIVYRARDKVLDEIVALKVLNDYLTTDPVAVERFKREARAAKRLTHPNIVRIHDMFEHDTKKFLSMEFIEGEDLKKILQQRRRLEPAEAVRWGTAVCDALSCAHQIGIIHRDIKPANIMLTHNNEVKVTDFGIAKILRAGPEATRSGSQIMGTPLYMAPEQIRGTRVDARTDIYSFGATFYEAVSGKPPFHEGNIEYHHLNSPPEPLQDVVPPALGEALLKCLQKEPSDRFQTTDELKAALLAAIA